MDDAINRKIAREFAVLIQENTPGSAGRLAASIDHLERIAKEIVGANRFTPSEFCQKVPDIDRPLRLRIALPYHQQSLNVMGGTLYAEMAQSIDLLFEPYAQCVLTGKAEALWIDDRPADELEKADLVRECMAKDTGSTFDLAIAMPPLDDYAHLSPLSDRAAARLFSSHAVNLPGIERMERMGIGASRLLTGCLEPGTMTIPKQLRAGGFHHYAFRTDRQTWSITAPGDASTAGLLPRAITIAEPLLDSMTDLTPYLHQFRDSILNFMRSRTAENAWLNFDDDSLAEVSNA